MECSFFLAKFYVKKRMYFPLHENTHMNDLTQLKECSIPKGVLRISCCIFIHRRRHRDTYSIYTQTQTQTQTQIYTHTQTQTQTQIQTQTQTQTQTQMQTQTQTSK